mgnify:CR=1 FL=1
MIDIIKQKICEIEEKEQVKIIYATESGSRAWGFVSPNSDYDVRFIYIRKPEFYLKLEKTKDFIEYEINDIFDINGWDISKTLKLLHSSNPTLFEWANSPYIYKKTEEWTLVQNIMNDYFLSKKALNHYLSTAKNQYNRYLKDDIVKLKKYFYILRPILACKWILNEKTPPPMLFAELVNTQLEKDLKSIVENLVQKKINSQETELIPKIQILNEYIEENFIKLNTIINNVPKSKNNNYKQLNDLFLNLINFKMLY